MNLLALIKPAFTVLYHGQSLTNAETWKNAQALTNLGIAIGAIMAAFIPGLEIPADVVGNIAVAIAGLANWYFTLATSEKVGLPQIELIGKPEDDVPTTLIPREKLREIPAYAHSDDGRWVYIHRTELSAECKNQSDVTESDDNNNGGWNG